MSPTIKAGACAKMVTLPLAWVPGRQVAPGASATRARVRLCTVFVTQFTSDRCLELIMWLELTRKRDQHDASCQAKPGVVQIRNGHRPKHWSDHPHQRPRGR